MTDVSLSWDLPFPTSKVWRALTEPELVARWLMKNDIAPVVGKAFQFKTDPAPWWENGVIDAEVLAVEPEAKLSYTWKSGALDTVITWTLTKTATGTRLEFVQRGFRDDQTDNSAGAEYGWNMFIEKMREVL